MGNDFAQVLEHREKKDAQALRLFQENKDQWFTVMEINNVVHTSDARKIISNLIKQGYPIEKRIIDNNGTKIYRLVAPYMAVSMPSPQESTPDNSPVQLTLF